MVALYRTCRNKEMQLERKRHWHRFWGPWTPWRDWEGRKGAAGRILQSWRNIYPVHWQRGQSVQRPQIEILLCFFCRSLLKRRFGIWHVTSLNTLPLFFQVSRKRSNWWRLYISLFIYFLMHFVSNWLLAVNWCLQNSQICKNSSKRARACDRHHMLTEAGRHNLLWTPELYSSRELKFLYLLAISQKE